MSETAKRLAVALAAVQLLDAAGNELVPRKYVDAHLDHLRVPMPLRPLLPVCKAASLGLIVGLGLPEVGAAASAGMVAYYANAIGFHARAGDNPIAALPAALLAAAAAVVLARLYLPATIGRGHQPFSFGHSWSSSTT